MKKQTAIFLVMFTTVSAFGQNDSTPQKTNDIKKLLEITNVQQQAEQLFELFVPQIQSLSPLVPQEF
jgi:hypothetical protein